MEISSVAEAEADSAFLSLSQVTSLSQASQWHSGLLKAIESLSTMPKRCALAKENEYFSQEIRQLLYGQRRNSYRILFTVLEEASTDAVPDSCGVASTPSLVKQAEQFIRLSMRCCRTT